MVTISGYKPTSIEWLAYYSNFTKNVHNEHGSIHTLEKEQEKRKTREIMIQQPANKKRHNNNILC